jgi:hypothetical protein
MRTLVASDTGWSGRRITPDAFDGLDIDADEFRKDYPKESETLDGLAGRLVTALAPTLAESAAIPAADGYAWRARLLAPRIEAFRELARSEGMDAVHLALREHGVALPEGIVVIREVVGADRCGLEDAAATYVESQWGGSHNYWRRNPDEVTKAIAKLHDTV